MADKVYIGPQPLAQTDLLARLLDLGKRQTRNEGGAVIDPVLRPPDLAPYDAAIASMNAQIAAITAAAHHTFTAAPTTPYVAGDVWFDGGLTHVCANPRATGAYVVGDWTLLAVTADYGQFVKALTSPEITGGVITGGKIQTATSGKRTVIDSAINPERVSLYSGADNETSPGYLQSGQAGGMGYSVVRSPSTNGSMVSAIMLNVAPNGDSSIALMVGSGGTYHTVNVNADGTIAPLVPWTAAPAFTNSWANYGSPYGVARYQKDAAGFVHLAGCISSGTMAASAFTLPADCRPTTPLYIACMGNGVVGRLYIGTDGTVVPSSPATNVAVFLDGVSFPTA